MPQLQAPVFRPEKLTKTPARPEYERPFAGLWMVKMKMKRMRACLLAAALAAIISGTCSAERSLMPIDDVFSPEMLWSEGQIIVLEGVSDDQLIGDEDRLCCEMIYDEFVGETASVEVRAVLHGSEHDYLIGRAWVRGSCVNKRVSEIIEEIVSEREEES